MRLKHIALLLLLLTTVLRASAADYVVTTTADSGEGSLRAALNAVSGSLTGSSTISFNIPTSDSGFDPASGTWTILLHSNLPYILGNNITIDGTTQTANQGDLNPNGPEVVIKSTSNVTFAFGVVGPNSMVGRNNTIRGFALGGFEYAIMLFGAVNCSVSDCHIGIMADGVTPFSVSNSYGIGVTGGTYMGYTTDFSHNITVSNNVISGNTIAGIALVGAYNVTVASNRIGCDRTGTVAVPNSQGVYITSAAHDNVIGGETAAARNILSGNTNAAVVMDGMNVRANVVKGNYIGLDSSGSAPLPNHYGVIIQQRANGNIVGGSSDASRNIISCNSEIGVYIQAADSNRVSANYIGLDKSGAFSFNDSQDIPLQANGVEINSAGRHNIIGGASAGERNVISGNKIYGCIYYGHCSHNNIAGNYIGSDASGSVAIPNATGICVDGSSNHNIMENNLLSGNRSYGLFIVTRATDSNIFRGNYVGCDASGLNPLPNGMDGIRISQGPVGTQIGGSPSEANIIAHNGACGVYITNPSCVRNRISCNSFYDNGSLAIDLYMPGVTANDAGDIDGGANNLINYPVIQTVSYSQSSHTISGTLDTPNPSAVDIQIYLAANDHSAHGEGMTYLLSVSPSSSGAWSAIVGDMPRDSYFTALAIDSQGNTSEFSLSVNIDGQAEPTDLPSPDPDDPEGIIRASCDSFPLVAYPNPTSGWLFLKDLPKAPSTPFEIFSADGRLIQRFDAATTAFDLSTYPKGIYILHVDNQRLRIAKQ